MIPSRSFAGRLMLGVVIVCSLVACIAGYFLYQVRQQYEQRTVDSTQNLAHSLEIILARLISRIDIAVLSVVDEARRQLASGGLDDPEMEHFLSRLRSRLPEIAALRLADTAGNVTHGIGQSLPTPVNIRDRDYFLSQSQGSGAGLTISKPLRSRISGKWIVALSRRIERPDGSFGGIAYCTIDIDRFTTVCSSYRIGPHGAISLCDDQLAIIARCPEPDGAGSAIGNKIAPLESLQLTKDHPEAWTYSTKVKPDGIVRIICCRKVTGYPLYVFVGQATADYLAPWHTEMVITIVIFVLFVLIMLVAVRMILRVRQHEQTAAAGLARLNEQLEAQVTVRTAELRIARDAAEVANTAKSIFLANMSHEIRTPLNAVLGYAQLLSRSASLAPEHRQAVQAISHSGDHLLQLISDILEMSRIEAGRMACNPEDFDIHAMLDNLNSLFLLRAKEKGLGLHIRATAELPRYLRTDPRKLRQILINLLANAVKFTRLGEVELVAGFQEGRLVCRIRDTGAGIAASDLAQLFQPFVQTRDGSRQREGTGLGLAISQGFAKLMGGTLTVASTVGQGSTFTVELPVTVATTAIKESRPRQVAGLAPGQIPPRLLVAEDHADSRNMLVELLRSAGCEVEAVGDGAAAVAACQHRRPDLIWMDIDMPIMDGLAAATAIRALPGPSPVIVALTAAAFTEDRARIFAGGCDEVEHKPIHEENLFQIMERMLGISFQWARQEAGSGDAPQPSADDLRRRLAAIPPAERTRLIEAVDTGSLETCEAILAAWPDRELAQGLSALFMNFAFEHVRDLLIDPGSRPEGAA